MWIGSVMLSCPQIDINLHNRHQIKRLFLENFFAGRTSVDQLESWQTWRWWGASRTSPNIMAFNWYGTFQSGVFNLIAVVIQHRVTHLLFSSVLWRLFELHPFRAFLMSQKEQVWYKLLVAITLGFWHFWTYKILRSWWEHAHLAACIECSSFCCLFVWRFSRFSHWSVECIQTCPAGHYE